MEVEDKPLMTPNATAKLNTWKTTFLIMAQMMGAGVLSLPHAIYISKIFGIMGIILIGILSCYCGVLLSRCMVIIENSTINDDEHIHSPYPLIGEICFGKLARRAVKWCVVIASFGLGVVLLLLTAELANELNLPFAISYCHWIVIFGILHIIPSLIPSPKDLWQIGVFSVVTSVLPYFIVIVLMISKFLKSEEQESKPFEPTVWTVIIGLSSIMFYNGPTFTFPTIQHDMKRKRDFKNAVSWAYLGVVSFYFLFGIISYIFLTEEVNSDILSSLPPSKLLNVIRIIFMLHTIVANIIQINPLFQELEKAFNISIKFSFKMALSRTAMLGLITIAGLTIPKFNYVLNILGAATVPLLTFIFPSMFYLKLISKFDSGYRTSFAEKCLISIIIVLGLLMASTSTYVTMHQAFSSETSAKSCFIK